MHSLRGPPDLPTRPKNHVVASQPALPRHSAQHKGRPCGRHSNGTSLSRVIQPWGPHSSNPGTEGPRPRFSKLRAVVDRIGDVVIDPRGHILQRVRTSRAAGSLRRRLGLVPVGEEARWDGVRTPMQAARALASWGSRACGNEGWALVVGDGGRVSTELEKLLRDAGVDFRTIELDAIPDWSAPPAGLPSIILCVYPDAQRTTATASLLATHADLQGARFEYVSGLEPERSAFTKLDEYRDTWFMSPLLLDQPSPYEIYEESLQHFEQKCGLRDYLDLYQAISHVIRAGTDGDIAEFGSYRGHSGYLIARTLDALASDKRLFMFDTFESFPEERYGVDRFWSRTHDVDFESVRRKFEGIGRVTMVKGDFTETLATSGIERVALAYIDCDSYRATKFLIDALMPSKIVPGGLLVCEDYGHPALLGNRVAVHEALSRHATGFRWFSQFSGLFIVSKP